jgi:uncharacterized protein
VPLAQLHLARENESGPGLKALREAAPAEHKFFELHARAPLIDGLYASVVVLVEGPTERGAFPVLWASHRPGDGLDEHRIELVDCESIDKMPSFVRFFKELGIPVIAVADADQPQKLAKVAAADPDVLLSWSTHKDWEGVVSGDDATGVLGVRRGKNRAHEPLPAGLIPGGRYRTDEQRAALRRLAGVIVASGLDGPGEFQALRDILRRCPPRITGLAEGTTLQGGSPDIDHLKRLAAQLDSSCLFIQGPPGSGKTWTGAQLIVHLIALGRRVGVAATSHKAVHNLLHEIEDAAVAQGANLRGWKKCSRGNPESEFSSRHDRSFIENEPDMHMFPPPEDVQLVAGTAWLYAPECMDGTLDYLVIDEAGQVSLADALAMGTAARNLILLGDPLQLAQVSQGTHPDGTGASVLEHLLGEHGTIPPERGIFLDRTRRMHPDVCRFVSEVVYESRLHAIAECAQQRVNAEGSLTGTGVRFIEVDHTGNMRASTEEADAIAVAIAGLAEATVTESDGVERRLELADVMVVSPYNAQVSLPCRSASRRCPH